MKKVLLIDDEIDFSEGVKKNLEATGELEVSICSDSAVAVQAAKEVRPDVILLDILMPGMSGPEIAGQLRGSRETKAIPIIFLTAMVTEEEATQKKNGIGGELFVAKPVETDELMRVIDLVARS